MVLDSFLLFCAVGIGIGVLWWLPILLVVRKRVDEPDTPFKTWHLYHMWLSLFGVGIEFATSPASAWAGFLAVLFPWAGLFTIYFLAESAATFFPSSLLIGCGIAALVALCALAVRARKRPMIVAMALIAGSAASYWHAEFKSRMSMKQSAINLGLTDVERRSLLQSRRRPHRDDYAIIIPHATAMKGSTPYIWSYGENAFVEYAPNAKDWGWGYLD